MKRIIIIILISFLSISAKAFEYEAICDIQSVTYCPKTNSWSTKNKNQDNITDNIKADNETNNTMYHNIQEYNNEKENIDFNFIYKSRLIGVDNNNLKFYEIIFNNDKFEEKELTADEVQEIFKDIDVIKISDFNKGTYTILSNNEPKDILLMNDTNLNLEEYCLKSEKNVINNEIKSIIKLPKKGKIYFYNMNDKTKKVYTIKIK